jgi:hypothetical protein
MRALHPLTDGFLQRGYVLVTSLIFLMVLTLVAVIATKNTTLELKMSHNFLEKSQAFEGSEAARLKAGDLVDALMFYRGWPANYGGTATTTDFDGSLYNQTWPATMQLMSADGTTAASASAPPQDYTTANYGGNISCNGASVPVSIQCIPITLEYQYSPTSDGTYAATTDVNAYISVFRLGVFNNAGSGTAMNAGYEGTGKGAAGAGAAILLYIRSQAMMGGLSSNPSGAVSYTGADFRDTVRN